nr:immunoglobulin heavy chain junction region [Macaca mulatta]
CVRGVLMDVW